jgi:hypothetical protein
MAPNCPWATRAALPTTIEAAATAAVNDRCDMVGILLQGSRVPVRNGGGGNEVRLARRV